MTLLFLVLGTIFGFVLSRSGAADYNFVQSMFLFKSFQLYGIIGTAIVLTAPGLWLIKRRGRTALGQPLKMRPQAGTPREHRRRFTVRHRMVDGRHVSGTDSRQHR